MSLPQSYPELCRDVSGLLRTFTKNQPEAIGAFYQMAKAAGADGVLDKKTKEFVALGIAIAARCDDCIGFHVKALVDLGATRQEIEEVLATAVYMGGGPSLMYASHALKAFEQFTAA